MKLADYFFQVYDVVRRIPSGRVATYGQIAMLTGYPHRARMVGRAMSLAPAFLALPCHRVLGSRGQPASHFSQQIPLLVAEGVLPGPNGYIDLRLYGWNPLPDKPAGVDNRQNIDKTGGVIMPCISTKTNVTISAQQENELKAAFGKAIALIPGKSENWLMLHFQDACHMYFKGDSTQKLAFVEVAVFGRADPRCCDKLTGEITRILTDILGISPDGVYVKYSETENWGWNGKNF